MQKQRPGFFEQLPAEPQFWQLVDRLVGFIQKNQVAQFFDELRDRVPTLASRTTPTPFGSIKFPAINPLPEVVPPTLTERHKDILKSSVAVDLAALIGIIPVVGDYVSGELSDAYMTRMEGLMTEKEWRLFKQFDVVNPINSLAAMRAIINAQRG